jgi:hypothetical protein
VHYYILFLSWLEHFALPNRSDGDRISASFDLALERRKKAGSRDPAFSSEKA